MLRLRHLVFVLLVAGCRSERMALLLLPSTSAAQVATAPQFSQSDCPTIARMDTLVQPGQAATYQPRPGSAHRRAGRPMAGAHPLKAQMAARLLRRLPAKVVPTDSTRQTTRRPPQPVCGAPGFMLAVLLVLVLVFVAAPTALLAALTGEGFFTSLGIMAIIWVAVLGLFALVDAVSRWLNPGKADS